MMKILENKNYIKQTPISNKADCRDNKSSESVSSKKVNTAVTVSALGIMGIATFCILSKKAKAASKVAEHLDIKAPQILKDSKKALNESVSDYCADAYYSLNNVSKDIPVNNSEYQFLDRNPIGFYLEYGQEINTFLRSGKLNELPTIVDDMPSSLVEYLKKCAQDIKGKNRAIVDSVKMLDEKMTSVTTEPVTVYRDAPASWLSTAKNGILEDKAFCSTSIEAGASMEGLIGNNAAQNIRYKIRIPKGATFLDLTHTYEKEMLLPRNSKFRVINNDTLELIV